MKAITIWQPWASLIALGAKEIYVKRFETRSWATSYRGPIAIHAAALNPFEAIKDIPGYAVAEMRQILKSAGILTNWTDFRDLPKGEIIATAELVNCFQIARNHDFGICASVESQHPYSLRYIIPSQREMLFGDWTPGRYAWELANVQMLPEPIPAKGKQRLWEWNNAS